MTHDRGRSQALGPNDRSGELGRRSAASPTSSTIRPSSSSGREIAPLTMPLSDEIHSFPALPRQTFAGLPGLLADSLPDRFGNALIDAWLVQAGPQPR